MAYPTDSPWDGYFCWQCSIDGTKIGGSNASDGEIYFVTALFMAADKWGEPRYADEANEILRKVSSKDGPATGVYNLYDDSTRLVTFVPNEEVHWFSDPSYCLPAFLDLWAEKADARNDFWRNAADKALAREYVQRLWDVRPPTGKWRYYVGMVYFLSMLHVSGHFNF